ASLAQAIGYKIEAAKKQGAPPKVIVQLKDDRRKVLNGTFEQPTPSEHAVLGDPTVVKVRMLLRDGRATLGDQTVHDGVQAWPITLHDGPAGAGRPRDVLWGAVADGRPLELRIDSGPGTPVLQTTKWTTYEVVPEDRALLDLGRAH